MGQRIINIFSALSFDRAGHGLESCVVLGKGFTPVTALLWSDRSWFCMVLMKDNIRDLLAMPAGAPQVRMGKPG